MRSSRWGAYAFLCVLTAFGCGDVQQDLAGATDANDAMPGRNDAGEAPDATTDSSAETDAAGASSSDAARDSEAGAADAAPSGATATYPNFDNFVGVDHLPDTRTPTLPLKWIRWDVSWKDYEATQGTYDDAGMNSLKKQILAWQQNGLTFLPMISDPPAWAAAGDGTIINPTYIPQWQNFVRWVVSNLSAPPYNLKFFQIWNEPSPAGWYHDTLDHFLQNAFIPGATAIHEFKGCKVVYAGHDCNSGIDALVAGLTNNDAWTVPDILDIHYYGLVDMDHLYTSAQAHGVPHPAVWQTEIGYTLDASYLPNVYPRIYSWAVNRWVSPDQFKLMWYAWEEDGDKSLTSDGSTLTAHGKSLRTLSSLFAGTSIQPFSTFSNDQSLSFDVDDASSSIEGFRVDDRAVIAIHAGNDGTSGSTITLTFPASAVVAGATAIRVDVFGNETNYTVDGNGSVTVPIHDANNDGTVHTLYVKVPLR